MQVKRLTPTEETYQELQKVYDYYNQMLFSNELPGALIVMTRRKHTFGYYSPKRFVDVHGREADEIALNQSYFAVRSVEQVLSTLAHEMCHQYQHHFGKISKRSYHNQEFAAKMEEIGLITSSTGYPGGSRVGEHVSHYIAEDGKFILATRELLKTAFGIIWYDRHPDPQILSAPSEDDVELALKLRQEEDEIKALKGKGRVGRKKSPISTVQPAKLTAPAITTDPILANSIGGQLLTVPSGQSDENNTLEIGATRVQAYIAKPKGEEPPKSGKRAKYTCPSCRDSVWGKSGIHLICGREACNQAKFEMRSY